MLVDSALVIIGALLGSFWIGYLIDQLPVRFGGTEMPRLARMIFFTATVASLIWMTLKLLIGRITRPLPDASLALLIERSHPELGGRLTTSVELLTGNRLIEDHSRVLLKKVHQQAATLIPNVEPNRLFRRDTLIKRTLLTGPLTLAAVLFLVLDPSAFVLAAKRLTLLSDTPWPRRADLEMVGIEIPIITAAEDKSDETELLKFDNQIVKLPVGSNSSLRIRARAEDAELPAVCTVYYKTDGGSVGQSNMRRVGRVTDGFQYFILDGPPLTDLSESMTLSIRGLDDRLDDYRVQAIQPPSISDATISVTYPSYLKKGNAKGPDWNRVYQTGIRVEEGSEVEVVISSTVELGSIDVAVDSSGDSTSSQPQTAAEMVLAPDGMTASLTIPNMQAATTISVVPRDKNRISAQAPYRYLVGVIKDEPPEITLALDGIGSVITANAKLPMTTNIKDDYGAERSVVNLLVRQADMDPSDPSNSQTPDRETDNEESKNTPPLNRERAHLTIPDRAGDNVLVADLRELVAKKQLQELKTNFELEIVGETHDRYDLAREHTSLTEVIRLPIVTAETLLAFLERRELGLRARLEQTLDETSTLRDRLAEFSVPSSAPEPSLSGDDPDELPANAENSLNRDSQVRRLRIQQAILQVKKTKDELSGIATSIDDILLEMQNNRVDSVDRQNRLGAGVRDPIREVIDGSLADLETQLAEIDSLNDQRKVTSEASQAAVRHCEQLILDLTAILEKMLDLESYNEILDLVRGLIDDQKNLIEDTKSERKQKVLDLFK